MVSRTGPALPQCADGAVSFSDWIKHLGHDPESEDGSRLCDAFSFVCGATKDQVRASGQTYVEHCFTVLEVLSGLGLDEEALCAAMLHEVLDLDLITEETLSLRFGESVACMVKGVSRITQLAERHSGSKQDPEGYRKLLLAVVEDVRVVVIKLADCVDNVRHLRDYPPERAAQIAEITRDIYAPLANRLGIWQVKWELEDLVFRYLEPDTYKRLAKLLAERRADREEFIREVIDQLQSALHGAGIDAQIKGRPKHIFSIWRKMHNKGVAFDQLFDIRAVRLLVEDIPSCYAALGFVHSLWVPVPGEFDDYIAQPKGNMYQSLHTAVVGPHGKHLEVQIRTHAMNEHAELGVAAHWRYKEGHQAVDGALEDRILSLRKWLEGQDDESGQGATLDALGDESSEKRIYVFTPQGKVVDLPEKATPLDFAYAIHSQVGHRCRGAKVDGRIVPLTTPLKTGETVEAMLDSKPSPSRNWLRPHLGYITTSRARSRIKHWFNQQDYESNVAEGRHQLDRELARLNLPKPDETALLERFHYPSLDDLLAAVGKGEITNGQIAAALEEQLLSDPVDDVADLLKPGKPRAESGGSDAIHIDGVGNLLVQMAQCCHPVPYDDIVGYITKGRGVSIHRKDCPNVLHLADAEKARLIDVAWAQSPETSYNVDIEVYAYDRKGLLGDVTQVFSSEKINVTAVNTHSDKREHTAHMKIRIEISDVGQLSRLLDRLNQLTNVIEARRAGK